MSCSLKYFQNEDMFKLSVPGAEGMVCNFDITQEGSDKVISTLRLFTFLHCVRMYSNSKMESLNKETFEIWPKTNIHACMHCGFGQVKNKQTCMKERLSCGLI